MALSEYEPGAAFPGVIGRTTDESSPAWPVTARPAPGTPNVLFVVLDDTGFGQLGCYGSPIETPNFDALAANGLRYNNMHTTALCSPSRSCIITGRNHHSNGMAAITELASGYPGYNGVMPFENGMLSEMLLGHGYNTYMVGKWHLTPSNQETAAGPYDRWPLARGFERFYGFLGGDTSQWYPDLVYDNHQVEPPATPEEGYHLTEDLVDKSIEFIADAKQIDPDKPFYLHLCFGATHAPHHVPKEWADRYAGQFDDGWDAYRERSFARQKELGIVPADAELSRHDPDVPDWDSLPDRAPAVQPHDGGLRRLPQPHRPPPRAAARLPARAGAARQHDRHGHLRQRRQRRGRPDRHHQRGAVLQQRPGAARGQPRRHRRDRRSEALQPLPVGLDVGRQHAVPALEARDLPRRGVRPVHRHLAATGSRRGARSARSTRTSSTWCRRCSTCWASSRRRRSGASPSRRSQGVSFAHTFDDAEPRPSPHHTQYFEMLGHRADLPRRLARGVSVARSVVHRGRRRLRRSPSRPRGCPSSTPPAGSCTTSTRTSPRTTTSPSEHRDRLIALIGTWYVEAGKYGVLPIDGSGLARMVAEKPLVAPPRDRYTYIPDTQSIPFFAGPRVLNRPHSITATVEIPEGGAEGVLLCQGTAAGGYSLFIKDGRLHYVHNYVGRSLHGVSSPEPVPAGSHELRFEFEPTGEPDMAHGRGAPGRLQLYVDGKLVADATRR